MKMSGKDTSPISKQRNVQPPTNRSTVRERNLPLKIDLLRQQCAARDDELIETHGFPIPLGGGTQSEPFQNLWYMRPSVPRPNTCSVPKSADTVVGALVNTPPRSSHPVCDGSQWLPSHAWWYM